MPRRSRSTTPSLRLLWWNLNGPSTSRAERQIRHVLALRPRPDVIALSEVNEAADEYLRERLRVADYRTAEPARDLDSDKRRVLLASRLRMSSLSTDRFR